MPLPHFWEHTVGSGRATLALSADCQRQLRQCHEELGFPHVRFHSILCRDVGNGKPDYRSEDYEPKALLRSRYKYE